MTITGPAPWHRVVRLKEEFRSGELTLGQGTRPIYEDPARFFALTFPTHALRELVKDVAERLAGRNTKAVRQLELNYGGGKTHTLITLNQPSYRESTGDCSSRSFQGPTAAAGPGGATYHRGKSWTTTSCGSCCPRRRSWWSCPYNFSLRAPVPCPVFGGTSRSQEYSDRPVSGLAVRN